MQVIFDDDGHYWLLCRRMSYNEFLRYEVCDIGLREFVMLLGHGRIFIKPGWILLAGLEGHFLQCPRKDVTMLRYGRSSVMLEQDRSAFTLMLDKR